MQDSSTADMMFDIARLIEYVSSIAELRPGDMLLTGSPAGNGVHHGRFLHPGDVITSEVIGLGVQRNHCVAEEASRLNPGARRKQMHERLISQLAHVELLTPAPEQSLQFLTQVLGVEETSRDDRSIYLRCWVIIFTIVSS